MQSIGKSVNNTSIELINSATGERTVSTFKPLGYSDVQVLPNLALIPNTTYWMVIHPLVRDVYGQAMTEGAVAIAHTIKGAAITCASKIQSLKSNDRVSGLITAYPHDLDYGSALWDLDKRW